MNTILRSALVVGAGMAAYNYMQKNDMLNKRQMKRMRKRLNKTLF